jgi:hypothetical protein
MSIEAMNWSFKQDVGSAPGKFILVILANMANQEGKCWPGIDYLVKLTELSRRTVITHIRHLEDREFISRTVRPGDGQTGRKSNLYQLSMEHSAACAHSPKVHELPRQSADNVGQSAASTPKQSINNLKNKQSTSNATRFDEWWALYPKKVEKKKSKAIWSRRRLDQHAQTIIEDTRTRPTRCARWHAGYAPNPTTYLDGDRWEDEPIKLKEPDSEDQLPVNDAELEKWAKRNGHRGPIPGEQYFDYRQNLVAANQANHKKEVNA